MSKTRHFPWASVLVAGSILLLAAFEVFWLRSVYHNEKRILQEEQTMRLHSSIRELEDSLFQVRMWTPFDADQDSFACAYPRVVMQRVKTGDSTTLFTMLRNTDTAAQDSIRMKHRRHRRGNIMLGTLAWQTKSATDTGTVVLLIKDMITHKLTEPEVSSSDPAGKLVVWSDQTPDTSGVTSKPFFDVFSNTHFALSNTDYQSVVLRRMMPQILFALILFAIITAAFFVISRNLAKQRRLAAMRSNLINNITHELKTPIATVHVALEAIQSFDADTERARREEYLGIAQSEINRLAILVDKVLKTSSLSQEHAQLHIEHVDLRDLITQVLDTLKVQFGRIGANVQVHTEGQDFAVQADKLHLTGVVHNLIDNAMKYGGPQPAIDVHLVQQNGNILLTVTDRGAGIPKEYQSKVFDKFFRVPTHDTHDIKGHGLGLTYVAEVVREHHGSIALKSEAGHGTSFTVTLPKLHAN